MRSDLQRQTSRLNGAKSRGPATPEGKRRISRNSLRHGLLAGSVVIEIECLPRFRSLLNSLQAEFMPQTAAEHALVETMAVTRWRQMRLWALEKSALDDEIRRQEPDTEHKDASTRAFLALRGICDKSGALELINRYETRYDRQFLRLVRHFENLRRSQKLNISKQTREGVENNEQP